MRRYPKSVQVFIESFKTYGNLFNLDFKVVSNIEMRAEFDWREGTNL